MSARNASGAAALAVDPRDRFTRVAAWARANGLTSRHVFSMRRRHPDLWPPFLRSNTTVFVRVRDLEKFIEAVQARDAAQPDAYAANARKAHRAPP